MRVLSLERFLVDAMAPKQPPFTAELPQTAKQHANALDDTYKAQQMADARQIWADANQEEDARCVELDDPPSAADSGFSESPEYDLFERQVERQGTVRQSERSPPQRLRGRTRERAPRRRTHEQSNDKSLGTFHGGLGPCRLFRRGQRFFGVELESAVVYDPPSASDSQEDKDKDKGGGRVSSKSPMLAPRVPVHGPDRRRASPPVRRVASAPPTANRPRARVSVADEVFVSDKADRAPMLNSEGKPYERQRVARQAAFVKGRTHENGNTPAHTGLDANGSLDLEDLCTAAKRVRRVLRHKVGFCKSDFILRRLRQFDLDDPSPDFEQVAAKGGQMVCAKWGHTLRDIVPGRDDSQNPKAAMDEKRQRCNL